MRHKNKIIVMLFLVCGLAISQRAKEENNNTKPDQTTLIQDGNEIFRLDDFGDDDFWSGLLHLDKAIAGVNNRSL